MAAPKKTKTKKLTLERFAELVMDEFGKVHQRLDTMDARADRSEARLDRVEARLDTIDDRLGLIEEEIRAMRREIADIYRCIGSLEERGASNAGFAKEIDMLIHRVTAIEKRLDAQRVA